ncbi:MULTISPECIES: aminoacyl-histidine dipeptidase [unclassified Tenacibaculum]|uniref:aminoacyl-histidine dipeptidase n=1 Tax=unclassified Tenacibaculum TaxID=2635139 RepID=UPI001F3ACFE5|nr:MULTISPECIES: aminoacyl-histidine dipeptidase [unclassified Tenacibaculum]MCF2873198.1 aminoacyl-histidine dipeptidase [Tenacibaculum sp. Cn5-1]MCF2933354.1 aminoacyl-histidine dipeptidase [Tenacibaculum sp. Cn5-34]MCG7510065.1 aminoacyl-histidine dipeptidase [Tenacibaculum sp. Cn5-46]
MNSEIKNLEPKAVWKNFADLNAVPRPSKKEERVIQFMVDFGNNLNLETMVDKVGNVIIRKPASAGMENRKMVVMQSHLDMVHQKNADTDFDFDTEGIKMFIDGDWVKADGTTLGADNGLGVASIMAVLESTDIVHPAIEALFTIDEETGMTGAMGLEGGILQGEILLNLDTEEDDEIGMGCAGGVDITATRTYNEEDTPENTTAFQISITGLNGGHSGMDIIKGLGNANKIMNRLLFDGFTNFGLRVSEINGGSLRNAIPRESFATVVIDTVSKEPFLFEIHELINSIKAEFATLEPNLSIELTPAETPNKVMDLGVQEGLIKSLYTALNGVYRMSPDIEGLVETSNNIARVIVKEGNIKIGCLTRSSSETNKWDLANSLRAAFELAGFNVEFSGSYPGWLPNVNSEILQTVTKLYEDLHGEKPNVAACHAGLECGILGQNYPNMDMVSFGPNIKGAHSPDERAQISSTQKYWKFLLEILKNTPIK